MDRGSLPASVAGSALPGLGKGTREDTGDVGALRGLRVGGLCLLHEEHPEHSPAQRLPQRHKP